MSDRQEHVVLMAVVITAPTRQEAVKIAADRLLELHEKALTEDPNHQCWIAEDDRPEGWGDCDSAVFVPEGLGQEEASNMLRAH